MSLFKELKRRRVIQAAAAYAPIAWVVAEVAGLLTDAFNAPDWVQQAVIGLLVLGFPVAMVVAWTFRVTLSGVKKERPREVDEDMAAARAILAKAPHESIAVLPFENMSNDPEQEYFSDGLTEELLNVLAHSPDLRVAARTSSFFFKGKDFKLPEIGEQLNVAHVLEGSVRKAGNRIRITAQLIKVEDGYHLWSETYDRDLDDIFAIQDDIARTVARQLEITLLGAAKSGSAIDPEAYSAYLHGRHFLRKPSKDDYGKAVRYFEQALSLAPDYVPALVGLAIAHFYLWANFGAEPDSSKAQRFAHEAISLDPQSAGGRAILGWIQMAGFEFESAEASLSRAMSLAPGDADVLRFMASLQANLGRLDEALDYLARAIASDPLEPRAYHNQARYLLAAGRPEDALASVRKQMELAPAGFGSGQTLCRVYLALSQPEKALHVAIDEPVAVWRPWTSAMAHYALGQPDESNQHLAELIKLHADDAAFQIAEVCAFRNEADAALEWLERAYQQRDPGLAEIQYFVAFANVRNKRRYKALLKKLNLA